MGTAADGSIAGWASMMSKACNQAMDRIAEEIACWRETPEGRAALDEGWRKQKASMIARGLKPGRD